MTNHPDEDCPPPKQGWTFVTMLTYIMGVINERDRRYSEVAIASKEAVTAALVAAKELVASAFASAEQARAKAEEAQRAYDVGHNDLIRKSQNELGSMVRLERHEALADRVAKLEKHDEGVAGSARGMREAGAGQKDLWLVIVAIGSFLVAVGSTIIAAIALFKRA